MHNLTSRMASYSLCVCACNFHFTLNILLEQCTDVGKIRFARRPKSEAGFGIRQKFRVFHNQQLKAEHPKWWKVERLIFLFHSNRALGLHNFIHSFFFIYGQFAVFTWKQLLEIIFSSRMKLKLLTSDILQSPYYFILCRCFSQLLSLNGMVVVNVLRTLS